MSYLVIDQLSQAFGQKQVLQGLSFSLEKGEIASLLGYSGSGKTTALRCIAGFETPSHGRISLNGVPLDEAGMSKPAHLRRIGMVFQDYALFPHLNVADNVGFGLPKQVTDRSRRIQDMLLLVGLAGLEKRYPHELSGGQQQRVALARALVMKPDMLLLDEPFSSLDVALRSRLAQEVRDIIKSLGMTAILVSHDQEEAFLFADQVGILHEGRLAQFSPPFEVYHQPRSRFVAQFIGESVWLPGVADANGCPETELGTFCTQVQTSFTKGTRLDVLIRPDDLEYDPHSPTRALIRGAQFRGAEWLYTLALSSGAEVKALVPSHYRHEVGTTIGIRLNLPHVVAFEAGVGT